MYRIIRGCCECEEFVHLTEHIPHGMALMYPRFFFLAELRRQAGPGVLFESQRHHSCHCRAALVSQVCRDNIHPPFTRPAVNQFTHKCDPAFAFHPRLCTTTSLARGRGWVGGNTQFCAYGADINSTADAQGITVGGRSSIRAGAV